MYIDRLGIVHEGITYVPDHAAVDNCFRVRVLVKKASGRYEVVGEEEFPRYPSDEQIMWCISHYKGTQAVIENVFFLADLPFTEEYGPQMCMKCERDSADCEQRICPNSLYMDQLEMAALRQEDAK